MASLSGSYALSGPLSRRSLGTQSGTLRRLARQIERDGGNPTQVLTAASAAELAEPRIGSADSDIREQAYSLRAQRGLAEGRRRSMLNPTTTPASATETPSPASTRTAPPAPSLGGTYPPRSLRQGRIDGRPAGEVLGEMRGRDATEAPRFGREIAQDNISRLGVQGAYEDYKRRSAEEAANQPKPLVGPPATGPLQKALNEAMARRAQREQDEASVTEVAMEPAPRPAPVVQGAPPVEPVATSPATLRPSSPQTLGQAVSQDISDLKDAAERGLDSAGRAIRSGADTLGRGAIKARDAAIDAGVDVVSGPTSRLARFIPGRTGELLSRRTEETKDRARRLLRDALSRPPLTFTP